MSKLKLESKSTDAATQWVAFESISPAHQHYLWYGSP